MEIHINTHLNIDNVLVRAMKIIADYYNVDINSDDVQKIFDIMKNDEEFLNAYSNMITVEK